jgi:hypothetical protein
LPSVGEYAAFAEGGVDDASTNVAPLLRVATADHDHVDRDPQVAELSQQADGFVGFVVDLRFDDEEVEVASVTRIAACVGAEDAGVLSFRARL